MHRLVQAEMRRMICGWYRGTCIRYLLLPIYYLVPFPWQGLLQLPYGLPWEICLPVRSIGLTYTNRLQHKMNKRTKTKASVWSGWRLRCVNVWLHIPGTELDSIIWSSLHPASYHYISFLLPTRLRLDTCEAVSTCQKCVSKIGEECWTPGMALSTGTTLQPRGFSHGRQCCLSNLLCKFQTAWQTAILTYMSLSCIPGQFQKLALPYWYQQRLEISLLSANQVHWQPNVSNHDVQRYRYNI